MVESVQLLFLVCVFFFSSRRRHTRSDRDWSSDVCSSDLFPGQKGFVGGSMGDDAVIIQGVASDSAEVRDLQARALYSTVHGAGRVMSRTAAAGKRTRRGQVPNHGAL